MKHFYLVAITIIVVVFAIPSTVFSQNTSKKKAMVDSVYSISAVTVLGNRFQREAIPVQMLEGKTLQKLSVYSVADALRYFSGVQIKDYGGIGGLKTVNIRSLGSNHVGVFYDGVEIGNAQNGVVDLGRFSLDNMQSISLYNGQKSTFLQTAKDYASAGSIYMTTRVPKFDVGKKSNLSVKLTGGSFETINSAVRWEHQFKDSGLKCSINAEYLYTSGRYKFSYSKKNGYDTTEIRKNGDVKSSRIESGLWGYLNRGEWTIKLYGYDSERGYPGASVREEPGKFIHQDRQWDTNLFLQGTLKKGIGSLYTFMLNGKYAYDYLHYLSDPRLDITTMYVDNHYRQQEAYFSIAHLLTVTPQWNVSLANDIQWNKLNADLINFVYPSRYTLLSSLASTLQRDCMRVQGSLLHTWVADKTSIVGTNASEKSILTPTLVLSLKPISTVDLNFRTFYKRIFRMPTLNDLYYTFIGNKDLNPEYTNQYNVGFTYSKEIKNCLIPRIEFQIDAYFNQIDDKIVAMPTSNQFRWTMLNIGYVEIRGIDISLQQTWQVEQVDFTTRQSYTYQKAQDFTDKSSPYYGGQIPYIPWHSGSFVFCGSYKNWGWNYSFIYTGERYESVANIPENYALPWYTHDISVSKTIASKKRYIQMTLEVNNLLNQQYEVVQNYPMPGTNVKLKINISI